MVYRCVLLLAAVLPVIAASTLQEQIRLIAAEAGGTVGVACSLPGRSVPCALNEHRRFPMQSIYKLPIAMAVLDAIERGQLSLRTSAQFLPSDLISPGQHSPLREAHPKANVAVPVSELLRLAVSESDGIASDILLRLIGGPVIVDRYVRGLGIGGIHISDTEKTLGQQVDAQYRNYAEPTAMVALLRRVADRPPGNAEHTRMLLRWMTDSPTGAQRLKGLLPAGTIVAHKTGTSGQEGGITHATNDVGLIRLPDGRQLAIAVFVTDSPAGEAVREAVIARIAQRIWLASY